MCATSSAHPILLCQIILLQVETMKLLAATSSIGCRNVPSSQTLAIYACSSATLRDQRSRTNRLDTVCVYYEVRTTDLFNDKEAVFSPGIWLLFSSTSHRVLVRPINRKQRLEISNYKYLCKFYLKKKTIVNRTLKLYSRPATTRIRLW
jgi:hypothetical protein